MQTMTSKHHAPAAHVVITRPVGGGRALAAALRRHGAVPLWLPALSLRTVTDSKTARADLRAGLRADVVVFTSPAAVHFAKQLQHLQMPRQSTVIAVGVATAAAVRRVGIRSALVPKRQDSEGVLALDALQSVAGLNVAVIGATGGRGLLQRALTARGAKLHDVHVYRRVPARLDRRHFAPLCKAPQPLYVLISGARTLKLLRNMLPESAWARIRAATIVASSARVQHAARGAGCRDVVRARSATDADLLAVVLADARI